MRLIGNSIIVNKLRALNKRIADERGQALIVTLILLLLAGIIISPLLAFGSTGLKTGAMYENKTGELYAADSGIEDATWQVKYDHIQGLTDPTNYSSYDFTTAWEYPLSQQVNDKAVDVTIQNVWIPKNITPPPSEAEARALVEAQKLMVTGATTDTSIVISPSTKISKYELQITYYPGAGENLTVSTIGVWLPTGFDYYTDATHKSDFEGFSSPYRAVPVIQDWAGNKAVIWSFGSAPEFADFPNVTVSYPMTLKFNFYFKPIDQSQPDVKPSAVGWITTGGVSDIPYAWDANIQVYKMTSVSGDTTVESYIAKKQMRSMQSSMPGDYYATGNSNLSDGDNDKRREVWHDPSTATVTSSNIPEDAQVAAAYLYWSGWKNDNRIISVSPLNPDTCDNLGNWTAGNCWNINNGRFAAHFSSGQNSSRYLTLKNPVNLGTYSPGTVTISWDQSEDSNLDANDGLDFAFSEDGGATWSNNVQAFRDDIGSSAVNFSYIIPGQYLTSNFKFRFYLVGFVSPKLNCYIDNIRITIMPPDTSVVFKINGTQVYLDTNGPHQGAVELTATRSQVLPNYSGTTPHGFSYASYRDVTSLVRTYSTPHENPPPMSDNYPGYGTYSVGGIYADTLGASGSEDEWAYANWSLLIIYTSSETQGHQLYLYDKFVYSNQNTSQGVNVDFDADGQPGGTISGFIVPEPIVGEVNAAKMTCFVGEGDVWYSGDYVAMNGTKLWDGTNTSGNSKSSPKNVFNSTSMGFSTNDGIDIDTLGIDPPNGQYITWASNILNPGDTSAQIDLVTYQDVWNLVYIILSFRSITTTGGPIGYLIK